MNARALSLLVFCNLIWSFHPLLGKIALESFSPANAAFLRYGSAFLAYLGIAVVLKFRPETVHGEILARPRSRRDLGFLIILGAAPFAFSPILQLTGLAGSQAIDNAILIALEPLMTVFLGWIVLRERLSLLQWVSFAGAIAGFLLLSQVQRLVIDPAAALSLLPYFLMLFSLWGEAAYSVFGRKLVQNYSPLPLFGSAILIGTLILGVYVYLDPNTGSLLQEISQAKGTSLLALIYLGPLGTTLAYLIWIRVIRITPVALPALTLFVQPIFGTFLGVVFRDESFTLIQSAGALLILLSVALQSFWEWKGAKVSSRV